MTIADFINEKREPQKEATPTLAKTIKQSNEAAALNLKVAMPGEVIKYDRKKMLADVQPQFNRKYKDGSVVEMPIIYNVPVAHPRAGTAYIHMPIKKGDNVLLVFADRSMEKWLTSGGKVDPEDVRNHHIADAIAYPGLYPFNNNVPVSNGDDIIMRNDGPGGGKCEVRVKGNNHYQVVNNKGNELVDVLSEILKTIREAVVYTSSGAQKLRHSNFVNVHAKLKTFLET